MLDKTSLNITVVLEPGTVELTPEMLCQTYFGRSVEELAADICKGKYDKQLFAERESQHNIGRRL